MAAPTALMMFPCSTTKRVRCLYSSGRTTTILETTMSVLAAFCSDLQPPDVQQTRNLWFNSVSPSHWGAPAPALAWVDAKGIKRPHHCLRQKTRNFDSPCREPGQYWIARIRKLKRYACFFSLSLWIKSHICVSCIRLPVQHPPLLLHPLKIPNLQIWLVQVVYKRYH